MNFGKLLGYGGRKEERPFYAGTFLGEILNREGVSIGEFVQGDPHLVEISLEELVLANIYESKTATAITIRYGISFCKKNGEIQRIVYDRPRFINKPKKIVSISSGEYETMRNYNFSQQLPTLEKTN